MTHSRNSRRGGKNGHAGRELWSARPMSGYTPNAKNKRMARKIERARAKRKGEP